jgi:hypothetical protein
VARASHGHGGAPAGGHGDGAPTQGKGGGGVQEDRNLTRRSVVGSARPEEDGWWCISAAARSVPMGERRQTAVIPGGSDRFLGRGGRGRQGGAGASSEEAGEAPSSGERRRPCSGLAVVLGEEK